MGAACAGNKLILFDDHWFTWITFELCTFLSSLLRPAHLLRIKCYDTGIQPNLKEALSLIILIIHICWKGKEHEGTTNLHSGKLTWQQKMDLVKLHLLLRKGGFL